MNRRIKKLKSLQSLKSFMSAETKNMLNIVDDALRAGVERGINLMPEDIEAQALVKQFNDQRILHHHDCHCPKSHIPRT